MRKPSDMIIMQRPTSGYKIVIWVSVSYSSKCPKFVDLKSAFVTIFVSFFLPRNGIAMTGAKKVPI